MAMRIEDAVGSYRVVVEDPSEVLSESYIQKAIDENPDIYDVVLGLIPTEWEDSPKLAAMITAGAVTAMEKEKGVRSTHLTKICQMCRPDTPNYPDTPIMTPQSTPFFFLPDQYFLSVFIDNNIYYSIVHPRRFQGLLSGLAKSLITHSIF